MMRDDASLATGNPLDLKSLPSTLSLQVLLVHRSPRVLQEVCATLARLPQWSIAAITDRPSEARRVMSAGGIDAVVTGLRLREGNGFDLLPGGSASLVPVVILSRRTRPEDQRRAVARGADWYLCTDDMGALAEILATLANARSASGPAASAP